MTGRSAIACTCGGIRVAERCNRCGKGYGKKRANATERGYGADWRKASRLFLKDNPFCVMCPRGAIREAKVVDHVVAHRGDQRLFWDRKNWQALCIRCHNSKTNRQDR